MSDWKSEQRARGREYKARMVLAGIGHADVAEAMGVKATSLYQWLGGFARWPRDFEERIARAIDEAERKNGVAS